MDDSTCGCDMTGQWTHSLCSFCIAQMKEDGYTVADGWWTIEQDDVTNVTA